MAETLLEASEGQTANEGSSEGMSAPEGMSNFEASLMDNQPEPAANPEPAPETKTEPAAAPELDPDDTPISDWSKVDLGLGDDARISPELLASFGKEVAQELGLTPKQSKAIVNFQLNAIANQITEMQKSGEAALKEVWGASVQGKINQVVKFVDKLEKDANLPGLKDAINNSGAGLNPVIVRALHYLAGQLGEDSLNGGSGAANDDRPETALEGIQRAFREARSRR